MESERSGIHAIRPQICNAADQRAKALDLRIEGYSFREIGKKLDISVASAFNYVTEALDELKAVTLTKAEHLRDLELSKLDSLEAEARKRLAASTDPDNAKLSSVVLKIMESRRKLLGLDAPTKIETSGSLYTILAASPECPEWGKPTSATTEGEPA